MKTKIYTSIIFLMLLVTSVSAQNAASPEKFGRTLNLGVGLGYYGYVGHTMPVLHANFEFDIVRNLTIAPFITYYTYRKYHHWGNDNNQYRNYYYRETVVPIGAKATYYFDELLQAGPKWDFYAAASLGFAIRTSTWENGYDGRRDIYRTSSPLYADLHIGTEYHISNKIGLQLDLSTGVSTLGLGVHF